MRWPRLLKRRNIWEWITIEPTTRCNLRCPSCYRHGGGRDMPSDAYDEILRRLEERRVKRVDLLWRGEPTLHSDLPAFAEAAKKRGYYTYTSTNTSTKNLSDYVWVRELLANLDRIEICVDGYNQETLEIYRVGADWNTIIKNLETISNISTSCEKRMRILMFKCNEAHEETFLRQASKYCMDYISFAAPILPNKILNENEVKKLLPQKQNYQRYKYHDSKWAYRDRERCRREPRIIITVNGDIAPCCYDWDLDYPLGNISENDLLQIESNYGKLWPQMNSKALSICDECRLSPLGFKVNHIRNINVRAPQLYKNHMR